MTSPVTHEPAVKQESLGKIKLENEKLSPSLVSLLTQPNPAKDSYHQLQQQLMAHPLRRRMLFITSPEQGEGTTTTAANLAGTLSAQQERVLLVELRLTQPRLFQLLGNPKNAPAFEQGLRGEIPMDEAAFPVSGETLHCMAVRTAMSDSEASEQSGALNEFVVWAESAFDWIILDCPPITSIGWTRWFQLNADPVLLVVRSGVTRRRALRSAIRQLKDRLAGVILNDYSPR